MNAFLHEIKKSLFYVKYSNLQLTRSFPLCSLFLQPCIDMVVLLSLCIHLLHGPGMFSDHGSACHVPAVLFSDTTKKVKI